MTIRGNIKNYKASAMPPKPPIVLTAQVAWRKHKQRCAMAYC